MDQNKFEKWKPRPGRTPEEYLKSVLRWLPHASFDAPDEGHIDNDYTALRMILTSIAADNEASHTERVLAAGFLLIEHQMGDSSHYWTNLDGEPLLSDIADELRMIREYLEDADWEEDTDTDYKNDA